MLLSIHMWDDITSGPLASKLFFKTSPGKIIDFPVTNTILVDPPFFRHTHIDMMFVDGELSSQQNHRACQFGAFVVLVNLNLPRHVMFASLPHLATKVTGYHTLVFSATLW